MVSTSSAPAHPVHIGRMQRFARERGCATFEEVSSSADRVKASGILLTQKTANKAGLVFAVLTDGRDKIQLVIPLKCEGITPERAKALGRGTRVAVSGVPFLNAGRANVEPVPSLYVLSLDEAVAPAPIRFDEINLQREVMPGLVIGKLMSVISSVFDGLDFDRYEPRVITSSVHDTSTEPLLVRFPGRGADLSLEVSPLPQLLYAAVMTGRLRLYSPTRLFSRAYRDGYTSAASPIIGAVEVNLNSDRKLDLTELVIEVLARTRQAPLSGLPVDLDPQTGNVETEGTASSAIEPAKYIKIRKAPMPEPLASDFAYDVRQRVFADTLTGQTIIEGHEGLIAGSINYSWICVHVERLATGDFWRIRGRPGPQAGVTT